MQQNLNRLAFVACRKIKFAVIAHLIVDFHAVMPEAAYRVA
jgi:hypothetical protein